MRIEIDGLDRLRRRLAALPDKLNVGIANGINRTIRAIEQHELVEMERKIDRPTPFTMNALKVYEAKPRVGKLNAVLFVQPLQAKYLRTAIHGGIIPTTLTPVLKNQRLNKYGNLAGKRKSKSSPGGLEGVKGRSTKKFIGEVNGVYGLWQRYGRGAKNLKLLVKVEHNAQREKRWDFYVVGKRVAEQRLARDVKDAIRAAIRAS